MFSHGKDAALYIEDAGGVEREITGFLTQAGHNFSVDTAETSVFGTGDKQYVPGMRDVTIPFTGRFDSTVDGYLVGILGMQRNYKFFPQGSAAGRIYYSGTAILTRYEPSADTGDVAGFTGEFQRTGPTTRGTA